MKKREYISIGNMTSEEVVNIVSMFSKEDFNNLLKGGFFKIDDNILWMPVLSNKELLKIINKR
jgi:hypothetical protein